MSKSSKKLYRPKRLIFEGRSKKIFETDDEEVVVLESKARFPEEDKNADVYDKAKLNTEITSHIFSYLHSYRIPNHFIQVVGDNKFAARRLEMIPLGIVIRNIAAGSICQRYGMSEGRELDFPIIEMYYKNGQLGNPMVAESHVFALGLATPDEVRAAVRLGTKTNAVLRSFAERRRLLLADIWMEFGRAGDEIILGNDITPDSCRLIDAESKELFDSSRYRLGVGDYREEYERLHSRLVS